MLKWFRSKEAQDRERALELYGATVTQARQPGFFTATRVEDTTEGRTAMIILHLFLLIERLNAAGARGQSVARILTETFITDVDDNLREIGVGDLSVPKKVKRAAFALGERAMAYREAALKGDVPLAQELQLTIPGLEARPDEAVDLARYMIAVAANLKAAPDAVIFGAPVPFPPAPR